MKRPMRARSSGSASVMSSPLKRIWPSVTSRFGWPMTTLASVDLPEPFGPISAWISPARHREVDALEDLLVARLGVEVLDLERVHGSRGHRVDQVGFALGEGDELGERRALERLERRRPARASTGAWWRTARRRRGASRGPSTPSGDVVDEAGHRRDRALEREDDLVHADLLRRRGRGGSRRARRAWTRRGRPS